ncbi:lipase family protein [soil metagenome]
MHDRNRWYAACGVLLLAIVTVLLSPLPSPTVSAASQTPEALAKAQPGDLLRWEPMPDIGGHPVWRILYVSTDLDGNPIPVSGLIAVPGAPMPDSGFPLLAIGHPTSGVARGCAPSLILLEGESEMATLYEEALSPYLDAGYALVMTDFQGLGAAGSSSYVNGELEGKNILDSIRAARLFPETTLSDQLVLMGHSQGGHAVAFATQLAPGYAPGLAIDGVVMLAPAVNLTGIFEDIMGPDERTANTALILFVVSSWRETYPQASLDQVTTSRGQFIVDTVIKETCLIASSLAASLVTPSSLFQPDAPTTWAGLLQQNTPGTGPWEPPVLVIHGEADEVIDQRFTGDYVEGLCASGATVEYHTIPGATHFGVLSDSEAGNLQWIAARFAGEVAPSTCPGS